VSDSILCVHGGLSPQIKSISDIFEIERPIDSTEEGAVCDLLWSDPSETVFFWGNNPRRKVGCCFGISALEQFLENNKLQLLCRSHEMVESGYRLSFRSRLVTLFSAPNYLKYYKNSASFLSVKQDLECMIMCLRGRPKSKNTKLGTSKTKMIEQGENEE
jgi:serine/threonine-protein phosphatase PP1 catalytic subunit